MDEKKFIEIYEKNKIAIFRIAFSYLRATHEAEDVMQEAFMKLYRNPPKKEENIPGWLAMVARNLSLDELRKKKRERELISAQSLNSYLCDSSSDGDILELVNLLPEKYSSVIKMFYYGDMSIKDISIALKMSESNVKKRLERGREKLKEKLETNYE